MDEGGVEGSVWVSGATARFEVRSVEDDGMATVATLAAGVEVAPLQCHLTTCIYHFPIEPLRAR